MHDEPLKPIAIPLRQRLREFRVTYLPPITFLLLVAAICGIWMRYIQPGNIVGEVETFRANIISTTSGTIQNLEVDRLQTVTNGQVLAIIITSDPDQLAAEINAAEADLRLMKARMDVDKTRNLNSYGQLRVQMLSEELALDIARVHLEQAEEELKRAQLLFEQHIISVGGVSRDEPGLDVARRDRNSLLAEIATRQKAVADLGTSLKRLETTGAVLVAPEDAAVERDICAQRDRLQRIHSPMVLRSPIDGFVSVINHRSGERVTAGLPILVVSSLRSDRIVAWVRPPITVRPQIGDIVEVSGLAPGHKPFEATVLEVGSQLEPINPTLLPPDNNASRVEVGLPLLVQSVATLTLIPGEPVQLRIVRSAGKPAPN